MVERGDALPDVAPGDEDLVGEKPPSLSRREARASNLSVRVVTEVTTVRFDSSKPVIVAAVVAPCATNSSRRAFIA